MAPPEIKDELGYELLSMYGVSLEYPDTWNVELRPNSTAAGGDLAFKTLGARVFLTWGSLETIRRKFRSLDDQAEDSLKKMKKSGDVRRFEILEHREMNVNGHRSIFNSAKVTLGTGLLAMKTAWREVCTLHLHCEPSQKFLVLYADATGQGSLVTISDQFFHMSSSLRCHRNSL